ncbi:hypothetical protein [Riemerella columbipharyngis]|uniref:Uncharacterized protein n=1 Tax=Riemerella columbipharyngis TaxID=1071918 RepID=A0A1G7FUP2_9FLAO|nr:hypothetical protein [Riemerella columbipharyngis]SDE79596.1 hypothetical protein SAMN05421544_1285 [Riemerella columbipharyngis]
MYNDLATIKAMAGAGGVLIESEKCIIRKGVPTYFSIPERNIKGDFSLNYVSEIPHIEGKIIKTKRTAKLAISSIDKDFLQLRGRKAKAVRNAERRYKDLSVRAIKRSDIPGLLQFIDEWIKSYGKAKYGMQLHAGYDKRFFQDFWNETDYFGYIFHLHGKAVGYSVFTKEENHGAVNYLVGKSDMRYSNLSVAIDMASFRALHHEKGDVKVCWGASTGSLLKYKEKFNITTQNIYFIKYMEATENKSAVLKETLGILPVNVWDSSKANWNLRKGKWNEMIDLAGKMSGVENPRFATREDCWKGMGVFAEKFTGSKINGGASVLDPYACELILKLFMPRDGKRVYNPFGGGVQMGFVAGFLGYEYLASEIRKNQCDANNAICGAFQMQSRWVCTDSSAYTPDGKVDLVFTCPPYYKVEEYKDYEGIIPDGELNSQKTYQAFRNLLFSGYKKAIEALNNNCFFVIMVGDSRDKNGAYYCTEAETELFLRDCGLHIYNRIVYLEKQITRGVLSTRSIQSRKLPKVEQKIIVGYKGNINNIKKLYEQVDY